MMNPSQSQAYTHFRPRISCWGFLLPTFAFTVFAFTASPVYAEEGGTSTFDLQTDQTVAGTLGPVEEHLYQLRLATGQVYLITIEQLDGDLAASLQSADGTVLQDVDSPSFHRQLEWIVLSPPSAGLHQVSLNAKGSQESERYRIQASVLSEESDHDRLRLAAARAMNRAGEQNARDTDEGRRQAIDSFRRALDLWRQLQDQRQQANTFHAIAFLSERLGDKATARDRLEEALGLWRSLGDRANEAAALNILGLAQLNLGETSVARRLFETSAQIRNEIGDFASEATSRGNLCMSSLASGEIRDALPCYEKVLELHRQTGKKADEARVLLNLGWIHNTLGRPHEALTSLELGIDLLRGLEDRLGEAQALNNMAYTHEHLGELQTALEYYQQSLDLLRQLGNRWWLARLLNNIGYVYWSLKDLPRARSFFQEALPLRREVQDRRGEAITLMNLGSMDLHLGRAQAALEVFDQALILTRETSHRQKEAVVLDLIGQSLLALGNAGDARRNFEDSMAIARDVGDRESEAEASLHLGQLHLESGAPKLALPAIERALKIHRGIQFQQGEARALYESARAWRQLGDGAKARARVTTAIELIESLRTSVSSPKLRAAFLSTSRDAYDLHIDLLMDAHDASPEDGLDRQAFTTSERARARSLLDLLEESRSEVYGQADIELLDQRRRLKRRLNARAAYQTSILAKGASAKEAKKARLEFDQTLTELENLEALIRRQNPRYSATTQPRFANPSAIQPLLGPNTLLLEYALGQERGFLWTLSEDSFESHALPGRAEIELLALKAYEELSTFDSTRRPAFSDEIRKLASLLLGPLAETLTDQRLIVVPDGALHYLPFAALPLPESTSPGSTSPLISQHEVIHLPSASVLTFQRQRLQARERAPKAVAVLADPVFQLSDSRFSTPLQADESRVSTGGQDKGLERTRGSLIRLPSTRQEAESIVEHLPNQEVFLALGFQATKSKFLDGRFEDYRIIHLATHGVIDAERPELSAIVLSQVDASGRPLDGFIRLHDLYDLELNADLVVLSGCQTALGSEMRGEGLVGLTQGFMSSGAHRVIASLWRVQDRVTAEFMSHFYRALLVEGRSPAAALRQAQQAIRAQRRWRAPYFWAAFVLQGE